MTGMKVAIKEGDLSQQLRKELIMNEITVMKDSHLPNGVNWCRITSGMSWSTWKEPHCGMNGCYRTTKTRGSDIKFLSPGNCVRVGVVVQGLRADGGCGQTRKGLGHRHCQRIVHHDIKFDNILLDGLMPRAKSESVAYLAYCSDLMDE
ncbi:hypothetical protein M378DRAFT_181280 [Amanita muscaria Koide BX008]|uniref:Protein kinase domain-containing protein n=1 Tax=Amanita muscaria (strain Koide BX008) TaxID=946122 RepID=A0A0C2WB11_AMAMK|nr:hypothetical protein M378DRAFT_181280 [Amanita muscaria Koide BX008]